MPGLPVVSAGESLRVAAKLGYRVDRQRGSHVLLECSGRRPLAAPQHRELKPRLLGGLIRDAGLTVDQFVSLLREK